MFFFGSHPNTLIIVFPVIPMKPPLAEIKAIWKLFEGEDYILIRIDNTT